MAAYHRDEDFMSKVGEKLRQIREDKGLGQEELSLHAGFTPSQVGRIERAEINTSISHIAALAKVLGVHPSTIFQVEFVYDPDSAKKIKELRTKKKRI